MAKIRMDVVIKNLGERHCIFDLSDLVFVDNSGIFFFLKIRKALAQKGKTCALCNVGGNVLQIFRISKLIHLFTLAPDVDAAKKKLN